MVSTFRLPCPPGHAINLNPGFQRSEIDERHSDLSLFAFSDLKGDNLLNPRPHPATH